MREAEFARPGSPSPLWPYASATQCSVLRSGICDYQASRTWCGELRPWTGGEVTTAIGLRDRYAMPGTNVAYGARAMMRSPEYGAKPGTDIA
eukprot:810366-Rhodomonas_salina.2